MPLKLLQHKSWHVYSAENVARVQRDEAAAQAADEESDRRMMLADSEARLDRMRKKSRKRDRGKDEAEEEMERQLRGEKKRDIDEKERQEESGTRIIRPDKEQGKGKGKEVGTIETNGHLNFWAEMEAGGKPSDASLQTKLEKAIEKEKEESFTKVYLAKRGEGDPKGWYASEDGKTERERKEGVEATLERAYKDGEHKRLSDPMATMNAYLQRRTDILSGKAPRSSSSSQHYRERYITPATPDSNRGDLSPVITSLLAPRRRRGEPLPPPRPEPTRSAPSPRSSSTSSLDPTHEAQSRVSSERARAAALIAAKRREALASSVGSSVASDTPRSEWSGGQYNAEATREEKERRVLGGGGWGEQKRRRDERERDRGWGRHGR